MILVKKLCLLLLALVALLPLAAQERKVQKRPYIDERRLHYGFLVGLHMQDMELKNNGYIDPASGERWYAEVDNYNPGFSVGVLGELRLNKYLSLRLVPTLHFGQKHVTFHEQTSGRDSTQNIKSTYLTLPINLKVAAPRFNNYRPYLVFGASPAFDLTVRKHRALLTEPLDCFLEVGVGCDFYFSFFKMIPELKFCFGLRDILQKNRDDLIDRSMLKYTNSLDGATSKMIVFTLYFE